MAEDLPEAGRKWVSRWLFGCSGMVFGAVVIGKALRTDTKKLVKVVSDKSSFCYHAEILFLSRKVLYNCMQVY